MTHAYEGCKYGTLLSIDNFLQLEDGRASVETVGVKRFEISKWGEKDGYKTAFVKWIEDTDTDEEMASDDIQRKLDDLREKVSERFTTAPHVKLMIEERAGPQPANPSNLLFWIQRSGLHGNQAKQTEDSLIDFAYGDTFRHSFKARLDFVLECWS
jgi:Lon protease-like protein